MKVRALGLLSGGLDSSLSALLLLKQGIEVEGVFFNNGFCILSWQKKIGEKKVKNPVIELAEKFNIKIRMEDIKDEFIEILKNPKYGYGSAFNPCIDCRILMLKKAKEIMENENFDFVFTGEVLKQRPMTQMPKVMMLIERKSGLSGYIIRPLSQKLLPETIPEKEGKVNREELLDISGRRRVRQMELAAKLGLEKYPTPAGGCCFLTDKNYKGRFIDLFRHKEKDKITPYDLYLIKFGRHFRLSNEVKMIIGRNIRENEILAEMGKDYILIMPLEPGPFALLEKTEDKKILDLALNILLSYCKNNKEFSINFYYPDGRILKFFKKLEEIDPEDYRIK